MDDNKKKSTYDDLPIAEIENILGYQFHDKNILEQALTHRSLSPQKKSYERLEFLGDKILGFIIAEMLFQQFPDADEGELSKRLSDLVNQRFLSGFASHIGIEPFIQIAGDVDGTIQQNPAILADIMESLLAAIFLDGGLEIAKKFMASHMDTELGNYVIEQDAKSRLQIWGQAQALPLPDYQLSEQSGPPHQPLFVYTVSLAEKSASGQGNSKQVAMQEAAHHYWHSYVVPNANMKQADE